MVENAFTRSDRFCMYRSDYSQRTRRSESITGLEPDRSDDLSAGITRARADIPGTPVLFQIQHQKIVGCRTGCTLIDGPDLRTVYILNNQHTFLNYTSLERVYITEQIFNPEQIKEAALLPGDYEDCSFRTCDFAGADFSHFTFIDCRFEDCNLSLIKLVQTAFRDCQFTGCKMTGLHFDHCKSTLFSVSFTHCNLSLSSFYNMKLKKQCFTHCILHETDFAGTELEAADFTHADLKDAVFDNTLLKSADFRHAQHIRIDPDRNPLTNACFSADGLPGLLEKHRIRIA